MQHREKGFWRKRNRATLCFPWNSRRQANRCSGDTKHLGFSVLNCVPWTTKWNFYTSLELLWSKLFCDSFDLLYEHNEMSPNWCFFLPWEKKNFFNKKNIKNKKEKKQNHSDSSCTSRMQNPGWKQLLIMCSLLFLLINHWQTDFKRREREWMNGS